MRRRLALLLALAVVLTTGCLRAEVDLEVRGDGSGELRLLEAVDEATLARLDLDTPGDVVLVPTDLPEGVTAEPYRRAGFVGTELRSDFDDLSELADRVAEISDVFAGRADAAAPGAAPASGLYGALDDFTVARTPAGWYFEAGADLPSPAELSTGRGRQSRSRLLVQVTVRLPGRAVAHNADRVDGGRFAWNLSPGDHRSRLVAETTTAGGTEPPWGLLGLGLGLVAVAGGVGWFLLDDRRRPAPVGAHRAGHAAPGPATGPAWPTGPPTGAARHGALGPHPAPGPGPSAAGGPRPPGTAPPDWPTTPPPAPPAPTPPGPGPQSGGHPSPQHPPARPPDLPPHPL